MFAPTEAGYYWIKTHYKHAIPEIIKLNQQLGAGPLLVGQSSSMTGLSLFQLEKKYPKMVWGGRIELPKELGP